MAVVLQFSTSPGIVSAVIRWATWSTISHVDFVIEGGYLLGARTDGGVQIRPPNYTKFSRLVRYEVEDAPDSIIHTAKTQTGKPYDYGAISDFLFHRDWEKKTRWFCSELVAWAFEENGYPLLNTNRLDRITPRDLTLSPFLKLIN